jgi:RimJ/RimL family protein N-acetyltransferase
MTIIKTPRLLLRRWTEDDVKPFAAINADPDVMRWIGDGSVRDEELTRANIARFEAYWEAEGRGMFAVEVRETGELAGFTGLAVPDFLPEVMPAVEIGWRLGTSFWGRGYATEAAEAALRFAFEEGGPDRIISIMQVGNPASERVMVKLGMRLDRELTAPNTGRPLKVYAITAAEYATSS